MSRFIICRASAGSGKTYALVRQYIEIAISSPTQLEHRFGHILAVTFTNKAANGMKQRIMSQLARIVSRDTACNQLVDEMSKHLNISHDETVQRCSVLFSAIMHHYSDFAVATIDSFVHRLVRTFAHDLHLPLNFNVLIDNKEILQYSVDELLSYAGGDDNVSLTKVLCSFIENRMEEGLGYQIEGQIVELAGKIFSEEAPRYLDKLKDMDFDSFLKLHRRWQKENKIYEKRLADVADEALEICKRHGLTMNDFPYKESGIYAWFEKISEGDIDGIKIGGRVSKSFDEGVLYGKSTPQHLRRAIETATPELTQCYKSICTIVETDGKIYNTRQLIQPRLYTLALLNKIRQIKDIYYKDNDTVHISEFNKRIAKEIADQPTPFIYERIGSHYYNYLIDEFQDTSRLQWHNFLPLLDEAMSHCFTDDTAVPGTQSLVVGDGKQAIYRFRQGDVRQFIRLPQVDSTIHGNTLQYNAHIDVLDTNYRSLQNIVEFNNRFFEWVVRNYFPNNNELTQLYLGDGLESRAAVSQTSKKEGGYVDVEFLESERLYQAVYDTIRHQVDDLGYCYGDILVLARENKTLVKVSDYLVAASIERPIPLVSSESFIISNSVTVKLLFSLLKYLSHTDDRVAALQVLRFASELQCLPNYELSDLLWQLHELHFDLESVLNSYGIMINLHYLQSLSLYDCCEEILRSFHLNGHESSFVATFLDSVLSYTKNHRSDICDFVAFFEDKINSESSSTVGDMDAVNLMTIHKAKGLEQKIVIYVMPKPGIHAQQMWVDLPNDADMGIPVAYVNAKKDSNTLFNAEFQEEERMCEMDRVNLLYVAMTRAEEKLIVLCEDKVKSKSNDNISVLHEFVTSDKHVVGDGKRFTVGENFFNKSSKSSPHSSTVSLSDVVFPRWEDRIGIAARNETLLSVLDYDSRRYGILMHDLLSHIITSDDVKNVIDNYSHQHKMGESAKNDITARILSMMEKEENRKFFVPGNRVLCEASIALNGEVRRPDRIVFADDHTWVVDFKTGTYNEKTHAQYQKQVGQYVDAIAAMGYPDVNGVIIYL